MKMDLYDLTDFGEENTFPAVLNGDSASDKVVSRTHNISFCGSVNIFIHKVPSKKHM